MSAIDSSELTLQVSSLTSSGTTLQQTLFEQIRTRILKGFWASGAKLPSTARWLVSLSSVATL
ncbi:hypothetical protein JCM19235_5173 [Vibrio maritimus]|uniref:Uncharacterized protein n=1 Tax=Vibrio maritimus TaxID=990268 RepID=A0A090RQY4_9VIBR|nr:hypothetical protein JCM19235_5173 [Vibrio maritimus]